MLILFIQFPRLTLRLSCQLCNLPPFNRVRFLHCSGFLLGASLIEKFFFSNSSMIIFASISYGIEKLLGLLSLPHLKFFHSRFVLDPRLYCSLVDVFFSQLRVEISKNQILAIRWNGGIHSVNFFIKVVLVF